MPFSRSRPTAATTGQPSPPGNDGAAAYEPPAGDPWSPAPRGPAAPDGRPPTRRRRRRLAPLLILAGVAVLAVVAAVVLVPTAGYRYAESVIAPSRQPIPAVSEPAPGAPVNVLLVGSDSRAGLSAGDLDGLGAGGVQGQRADTIMIAHISPERKKVVLLSVPRDLRVQIDGRTSKINAALNAGPDKLVQVVERTTGIELNHYVRIDFSGFVKLVDVLGGVELCNETGKRIDDASTNLHMGPGCATLDGPQALSFVRVRKIDSDFQRIQRQQQFLRAVLGELTSAESVLSLPKLAGVGRQLAHNIETDEGLSVRDGLDLARKLGSLGDDNLDMRTYPSRAVPPSCKTCPAYVVALPDARALTKAIQDDAEQLPEIGLPGTRAATEGSG
jgi:LCP family protein required for cell wall assembly